MKLTKNMKIRKKIVISFTIANILMVAIVALLLFFIGSINGKYVDMYDSYGAPLATLGRAGSEFFNKTSDLEEAMIAGSKAEIDAKLESFASSRDKMQSCLKELKEELVDDEVIAKLAEATTAIDALSKGEDMVVAALQGGDMAAAKAVYSELGIENIKAGLMQGIDEMYDMLQADVDAAEQTVYGKVMKNELAAIAIALIAVIINTCVALALGKDIRKPIAKLRDVANQMAEGDVSSDVEKATNDEIGELTEDLEKMILTIREQAQTVEKLSNGDLTVEATPRGEKDLMGNSIKNLLDMDNRTMHSIKSAVTEVHVGAGQVSAASQALAQGSTEQASAIEEITASIDDITERTKVNANDANEAKDLVVKAKDDAELGNIKMKDMINAMTEINESSENISKIIKVIDDIAFQTNILALNAAVEAARAGQHGKGFAVVAEEVRNLAGKSAQAAKETAELIEDSILKVSRGSRLAEETAEALSAIVAAIERIVELTSSIAIASNDQATAIDQIDLAIGQVSQVVQNNSATSEECAAASEELSAQAERLKDMIARYKLRAVTETASEEHSSISHFSSSSDNADFSSPVIDLGEEPEEEIVIPYEPTRGTDPMATAPIKIDLEDDFGKY